MLGKVVLLLKKKKMVTWILVSTSHFPKAIHSGPTTLGKRDWWIINPQEGKKEEVHRNLCLSPFVLKSLDASFCSSLCLFLFSFPFIGLNLVLTLTSWIVNFVLHFLPLFVLIVVVWLQLNVLFYTVGRAHWWLMVQMWLPVLASSSMCVFSYV